jgi:pyocin large subunit-like protein
MGTHIARTAALAVLALAAVSAGACDNGPSAVETRDRTAQVAEATLTAATGATAAEAATPDVVAKPALTVKRGETVDAKIARLYQRNGAAFGAQSPEDYLARLKRFTESPPAGVETVSRPNGDTLLYQASTNTFAVVSRDGTPRTMFKPDDGPAYWAQQKERAPDFGRARTSQN